MFRQFCASREDDPWVCSAVFSHGNCAQLDREIDEELREHMRMRIENNIANGMDAAQAAREARLRFGIRNR